VVALESAVADGVRRKATVTRGPMRQQETDGAGVLASQASG
jgi:hypothetical protein